MILRVFFILISLVVLNGCMTKQLKLIEPSAQVPLDKAHHWKLNARVAIRLPNESHTATLNWQKDNQTFDFYLSGAFGVTIAHIIQEKNKASLQVAKSDKIYHEDVAFLIRNALPWDFPIHQLSDWVKGLPSGNPEEIITRDSFNRIEHIRFQEWEISFAKYRKYQGFVLPKTITAKHPELTLKVVAKNWKFYE